jgi:hypothetical protein
MTKDTLFYIVNGLQDLLTKQCSWAYRKLIPQQVQAACFIYNVAHDVHLLIYFKLFTLKI